MAQTGTTFTLQSSSYQGRYLKLTCTSSQDIANNKTNISWKLESIGGSSGHYATIVRVNINGSEVYSIDKGYTYDAFPVTKGSTTGSTSVTMGSDGNKSITIYMDAAIYTSSTTRYSDTWTLNTVPRYPTISSFSVAKVSGSSTSVSVTWAGSAPGGSINKVEYSKDNGSTWTNANTTSSPFTISGLTSNTGYNFKIRVTSSASGLTATSSAYYQSTYQQPTANISTANISGYNGLSQIKVSWSSNMDIAKVEYSRDNGSTWYNAGDPNASSGNYTYTGLSENTSYNFKVRVTATTGSCVTTSGTSSLTTRKRVSGNLYINGTKVGTSNGQTGIALKNGDTLEIKDITNNAGCGYKLFFENPDNQNQYLSAKTTGTTAISMTAEQIRQRLQYMTSVNSQGYNVGIVTLDGSDNKALYYEFFGTLSVVNSNPDFSLDNWTYQDTNTNTVALTGSNQILVNGFSKLRVSVNTAATGVNYATISQYTVSGCTNGSSTTTGNIDCATATNGGTITVTARDSRGNTTSTSRTATLKDYFVPTLTSITATRSNGGVGTQTSLTFNGTWWNGNFGASSNTLTAIYRYKSNSTWSEARAITLTTSGNAYSFTTNQLYGDLNADGFTLGTTFTIEVTITDELNGGKSWTTVLNSGTPAIAISGNKIAIGKQYDTNKGGDLQVLGSVFLGNNDGTGSFQIHGQNGSNIYWKEYGYGDQFRIIAAFGGADDNNKLQIQGAVGGAGETPSLYNLMTISGKSGNVDVKGVVNLARNNAIQFGGVNTLRANSSNNTILSANGATMYFRPNGDVASNGEMTLDTTGNLQVSKFQGRPWVWDTEDTTNTWVLVAGGGEWRHRAIPATYNSQTPQIKMETMGGRITNANITHAYENNRAHLQLLQSSASMTSNKPYADGYIIHCSWDNNGAYCGQLYMPNNVGHLQFRGCGNGTWGGWENIHPVKTLYDNASGTTGTVTLSESASNFSYLEIFYGKNNAELSHSTKIAIGRTTGACLSNSYGTSTNFWQMQLRVVNVNGTSITNNTGYNNGGVNMGNTPYITFYSTVETRIYRVIGYR